MRILYAIQGTGNGHISRAREIVPLLHQYGQVDLLVSGTQADVALEQPLNYSFKGFSFVFGKNGGVHHWQTFKYMDLFRLWRDIKTLPLKNYDLIINDFEPITAWACKLQGRPSVALSHQASFLSANTPRPAKTSFWSELIFQHYAPITNKIGFHFEAYDSFINTPVIRTQIRNLSTETNDHITVYLPAFDEKLIPHFHQIKDLKWEVFTKYTLKPYQDKNVSVQPITHQAYNKSLASCFGLFTGGGFEGPAEAMFLKKKLLILPMKYQYEQICNAEAAKQLGVQVITSINNNFIEQLNSWIENSPVISKQFPDDTSNIISSLIKTYT